MLNTFAQKFSPLRQAAICVALAVLGMLLCRVFSSHQGYEFAAAFIGILLYTVMNSLVSVFHQNFARYVWPSWGIFVGLVVGLLLAARFVSGQSIRLHNEYIFMLKSIVFFYFTISLLVRLIRLMWEFAEEDEN